VRLAANDQKSLDGIRRFFEIVGSNIITGNEYGIASGFASAETPEGIVLQIIEIAGVAAVLFSYLRGENAG